MSNSDMAPSTPTLPKTPPDTPTNTPPNTPPFHLAGAFAPVREERTHVDLDVVGEIPADLRGTYVRNGPNPRTGWSPAWFAADWFAAEGMLHGVRLEDGRARWYRNRWLAGSYANTSVVRHAGRILALVEVQRPVEVTAELETVGPSRRRAAPSAITSSTRPASGVRRPGAARGLRLSGARARGRRDPGEAASGPNAPHRGGPTLPFSLPDGHGPCLSRTWR
ncbi:carotenoid oxygenase family protein [Sorangium sp. So ce429]